MNKQKAPAGKMPAAFYMLAVALARTRGTFNQEAEEGVIAELLTLPEKIKQVLAETERIPTETAITAATLILL